jgi:hypothetical protein
MKNADEVLSNAVTFTGRIRSKSRTIFLIIAQKVGYESIYGFSVIKRSLVA